MIRRPIKFVLADKNTEFLFKGFFGRPQFHQSLGCGPFHFDPSADLLVAVGKNDPGLYVQAGQFARGVRPTHDHLVIALDAEWQGSPGAAAIEAGITEACIRESWTPTDLCVVVFDPEVETWVWQDNPNVETAVGHPGPKSLRGDLADRGLWPASAAKPPRPKETLEEVVRRNRVPRSSALYQQISARVSLAGCVDPAFERFVSAVRRWYPP